MEVKSSATKVGVKCDELGCGWRLDCAFEDVPKWLNKPCPRCGRGEIVSKIDMIVWRIANVVVQISNDIDPEGKLPRKTYHVDTAGMKETAD